jgi:hypothetical protein
MRPFIVTMAALLFVTGCGGGAATSDSSGVTDADIAGQSNDELSIGDFIPGAADFSEVDGEQQYLQQEREAQEKIAACMAEEGFEYIPYVPNPDEFAFAVPESQEEFAEPYGFGLATMILEDTQRMEEEAREEEMAKDPNHAIAEAMSPLEQEAYFAALHGPEPDIDHESMTEEEIEAFFESWESEGCMNTAYEEMYNSDVHMEFYEQFGPLMEDTFSGLESDPRITDMEATWSTCMAEQGYEFAQRYDVEIYLLRRLEDVGAIEGLDIDPEGMGFEFAGRDIEPGSPTEAAVKEIAADEIAIAQADLKCSEDQEEVWAEVYGEAEARFIEEHRAELEQFKKDNS